MIRLIDDRIFTASADQLLYELERFKEEDMPPKEEDKLRLEDIYRRLQVLAGTEHLNIPEHLSAHRRAPKLHRQTCRLSGFGETFGYTMIMNPTID